MRRILLFLFLPALMALLLTACDKEKLPAGVVATVNGEPISLRQVEALYDVTGGGLVMAQSPSVELLRSQYGGSLAALVVGALIEQELKKAGCSVTDNDVQAAEDDIRVDYPPDGFEKFLQEEYIDLASWRELLRQRLSVERFQQRILRLRIGINADEVQAYYAANKDMFSRPRRVELRVLMGVEKEEVEQARTVLAAGKEPDQTHTLLTQQLRISYNRLPPQWQKDLKDTPQGRPTPVRELDGLFQCLVLQKDSPATQQTVVEAYHTIEDALLQSKLEPVFEAWLTEALQKSQINVTAHLYESEEGKKAPLQRDEKEGKDGNGGNSEKYVLDDQNSKDQNGQIDLSGSEGKDEKE